MEEINIPSRGCKKINEESPTTNYPDIYVLMATYNRPELLLSRSLPSILNQTYEPKKLVIVDDSPHKSIRKRNKSILNKFFSEEEYIYLINNYIPGAGGAWNKGIDWIIDKNPDSWIAILDDDDEWRDDHLEICKQNIDGADVVISGISIIKEGDVVSVNNPKELDQKDFYEGNPGWQGSNTFVKSKLLGEVDGYDENLLCCHDRDIAIRILNKKPNISFTDNVTVSFYLGTNRGSLTTSEYGKWTGLLQFFSKHREEMNKVMIKNFKSRSKNLFNMNLKLFDLLDIKNENPGFKDKPTIEGNLIKKELYKSYLYFRIKIGQWRAKDYVTKIFGPKYEISRNKIEIDLTYKCNLKCQGCNRSCEQAPDDIELSIDHIDRFVNQSIERKIEWEKIRLLGGEPTMHSNFQEILYLLADYKEIYPQSRLEIVTNGQGRGVVRNLLKVPPFFHIEKNKKDSDDLYFYPFNIAPVDLTHLKNIDFKNGCSNLEECGISLTPLGYYPCALSGGIDRIAGWNIGRENIPQEDDEMTDILKKACQFCGRFIQRIFVPRNIDLGYNPAKKSKSWKRLYKGWRKKHQNIS